MAVQSFSGTDFSVVLVIDSAYLNNALPAKPLKLSSEMQTITISSTASVSPVRILGRRKPRCYGKGARTFAGSMIFSVIDKDPFQELFTFDAMNSAVRSDGKWHVDMLPPFDIILSAINEGGTAGVQVISGITLTNTGTTYSVDDIYTESTYTYVAEHVSPFIQNPVYDAFLKLTQRQLTRNKTPDDLLFEHLMETSGGLPRNDANVDFGAFFQSVGPGGVGFFSNGGSITDPVLAQSLLESQLINFNPTIPPPSVFGFDE